MKVLLHDLPPEEFGEIFDLKSEAWRKDIKVVGPGLGSGEAKPCIGCFGCWVRTPGACVIRDGYGDLGGWYGAATELILLTRVQYGGYGSFVKRVMDRNIGYLLPFFVKREGEMHHASRYPRKFCFTVIAYGSDEKWSQQQTVFERLVAANAVNLNAARYRVFHVESAAGAAELEEVFGK